MSFIRFRQDVDNPDPEGPEQNPNAPEQARDILRRVKAGGITVRAAINRLGHEQNLYRDDMDRVTQLVNARLKSQKPTDAGVTSLQSRVTAAAPKSKLGFRATFKQALKPSKMRMLTGKQVQTRLGLTAGVHSKKPAFWDEKHPGVEWKPTRAQTLTGRQIQSNLRLGARGKGLARSQWAVSTNPETFGQLQKRIMNAVPTSGHKRYS